MKPASRNRFLASATSVFRSNAIVVFASMLGSASSFALDYNFGDNVAQPFSITASDHARAIGGSLGTFNDNGTGSVYDRGSERDVTYIHFDLTQLSGLTLSGNVSLNLPAWSQYGGAVNNGVVATANGSWAYSNGGATPGFTAIPDSANINGTFPTGTNATWTISGTTFAGYMTTPASFPGFAVTAGAGSQLHFNGLAGLTVTADLPEVRVLGATDWSAATYDNVNNILSVAGASNVSGGNVILATGTTLSITDSATLDSGTFAGNFTNNGGSLVFGSSANQTLGGSITGSGTLTKDGTGVLTLSGSNNYTGLTTVSGGTLSLATGNSLPVTGAAAIGAGATLSNDAPANTSFNIGALNLTGGTLAATASPSSSLGNFHLKGDVTVSGSTPSTISADVRVIQNDDRIFNVADDASGADLLLTGTLSHYQGSSWGYATKTGAGTMKLSGSVSIGRITVNDGSLVLEDVGADWQIANIGLINNAQVELAVTTGSRTMSVPITGTGSLTKTGTGTAAVTGSAAHEGGTSVLGGVLSLGNGTANSNLNDFADVSIASSAQMNLNFSGSDEVGSATLGGVLQGFGSFNATTHPAYFTGTGSLVVLAPQSGTWASAVNGDWETFGNWQGNVVANGADNTATFDGATGTTITLQGNRTIGNLSFSGLDYTIAGASKLLTPDAGSPTISVDAGRIATISTNLTSTGEIFKTGAGTLELTGINTSNGGMTINGGTLVAGRSQQDNGIHTLGSGPLTINNGTLRSTSNWTTSSEWNGTTVGAITINAGGTWNIEAIGQTIRNGLFLNGGSITATVSSGDWGALHLKSGVTAGDGVNPTTSTIAADTALSGTQTITVETSSQLNYSGLIHNQINTASGITKEGDGTLVFTGAKTYTGPTTINSGSLQLGDGTTSGSTPGSAITNNASLVVNPAGSQSFSQAVSGTGSLSKTGTGTLAITGPQSYTGDTIVSAGTLELQNNSASATAATVTNAGFETPDYSGGVWNYLGNDGIVAWSFTGGGIGSNGCPWFGTAAEGDQAGFIQINGNSSQTISVPSNGNYVVSFQSSNRPGYGAPDTLTVSIGATTVGSWTAAELATGGSFVSRVSAPVSLTAGTHTLTFTATTAAGDTGVAIDAVTVTNATPTNGSLTFKPGSNGVSNKVTGSGTAVMNGKFYLDLSSAAIDNGYSWTLVDHASLIESYGTDFSVASTLGNFTESPAGTWKRVDGNNTWTFTEGTGVLSLAVAPADPFLAWIDATWPSLSDKTPTGDPDNDGIENLLEYVLKNGDPSASNPGILPTVSASGANLVFTYLRRTAATGTTQTFQYGSNLTGWTDVAVTENPGPGVTVAITSPEAGIEQVVITVPKESNTKLFGRLQVVK